MAGWKLLFVLLIVLYWHNPEGVTSLMKSSLNIMETILAEPIRKVVSFFTPPCPPCPQCLVKTP
ncbi:hypothetical protein [Kwatta virus]|uniref:Uncharacterized protein n=1 Tax=Kwatta virus TaxID=1272945 RepID=A0A0D3R1G1_9RHAB|nr:hypothetical protein KM623_gp5 [Kwatta virus]AJR28295.1 hypothetical protein [Kwatta virus]